MGKTENSVVAQCIGGERLEWADKDFRAEFEGKDVEVYLVSDEGSHGRLYVLCEEDQEVLILDHYTGEGLSVRNYSYYIR